MYILTYCDMYIIIPWIFKSLPYKPHTMIQKNCQDGDKFALPISVKCDHWKISDDVNKFQYKLDCVINYNSTWLRQINASKTKQ